MQGNIVAAVQFEPRLHDVQNNLATAVQMTFEAAAKGARIIVLPELCTSGYVHRTLREASSCAQTKNGYQTQAFEPIANQFGCHIVFGYPELSDGKLYNSAAVVGPYGLVANFQKHNVWGPENLWAQPSEQIMPPVITAEGRLGVLICRDGMNKYRESYKFHNPGHKFYDRGSIDTIALLTNWGDSYGYPDNSWVELCESTGANVIISNRVGKERDLEFKGGSAIIDRQRRIYTFGSSFTSPCIVGGVIKI